MCLTSWLCSMRKRPSMPRKVSRAGAWVVGFTLTALALNGCASIGVKPWERDLMAQKAMAVDSHPLQSAGADLRAEVAGAISQQATEQRLSRVGGGRCGPSAKHAGQCG